MMPNTEEATLLGQGNHVVDGDSLFTITEWGKIGSALFLSPRELQIVRGVFDDAKEATIAHRLDISPHTVHTYLERIYRKLDVNSRVQMTVRVMAAYLELTNGNGRSRVGKRPISRQQLQSVP